MVVLKFLNRAVKKGSWNSRAKAVYQQNFSFGKPRALFLRPFN
jgi:hypothetical protein